MYTLHSIYYEFEFVKEKGRIEKQIQSLRVPWRGTIEDTLTAVDKMMTQRFQRYSRGDGDPVVLYEFETDEYGEPIAKAPTRFEAGHIAMKVYLVNTLNQEETYEYPLEINIPRLKSWPEDIGETLDNYMAEYQKKDAPKVYNHTIAEQIAKDIKEQSFIKNNTHFRVDVTNMVKQKATETKPGSCSVKVRILDTTGKGSIYEKTYTWEIYQLDTLEQMAVILKKGLALKEANNRTDKEAVTSWINEIIYNKDIVWEWKVDFNKELSTDTTKGCITGTIELKNPKSVIDAEQMMEVEIELPLPLMTAPSVIYNKVNSRVGENGITGYIFWRDEEDENHNWIQVYYTEEEMHDFILNEANTVLEETGEMYYVEYAEDESGKELFEYCLPTHRTPRTVSYTLVIKNEFTNEEIDEKVVVTKYVVQEPNGDLQTLEIWKADIIAMVEEGNKNGQFTNDMDHWAISYLIAETKTRTNGNVTVHTKTDRDGNEYLERKDATLNSEGWIKARVTIDDGDFEKPKSTTFDLTFNIPALPQSTEDARWAVEQRLNYLSGENKYNNSTTEDYILNQAKEVLKKNKFEIFWSEETPFTLQQATEWESGSIEGTLVIRNIAPVDGEEAEISIDISFHFNL